MGLDGLGGRICTFDCLYCEAGATETLTLTRKPYVPARRLLAELDAWKAAGHDAPDVVTLGGSGEPTLNTECEAILEGVKERFPRLPAAVLTNSALLSEPEVRRELARADIVLPSMDTLVEAEFRRLNRPHPAMSLAAIRQGLLDFRAGYSGRIFLEILLVLGLNDTEENLARLRDFCRELAPDRIDVTTMSRPGAHAGAAPVPAASLARFREALGASAAGNAATGSGPASQICAASAGDLAETIAASVRRRPQTAAGLAKALGVPACRVETALQTLLRAGRVHREELGRDIFYSG